MQKLFDRFLAFATIASRSASAVTAGAIALVLARILINGLFDRTWPKNFSVLISLAAVIWFVTFCIIFGYSVLWLYRNAPASAILSQLPSNTPDVRTKLPGFVAMEYYALGLNRTFVVFIDEDRLYGWKVRGPVANINPLFFKPYAEKVNDPNLACNHNAIEKLASLKGGFIIPRSEITSVELIYKAKWGMGGIPHAGRLRIKFASGKNREFVVLGSVSLQRLQEEILAGRPMGASVTTNPR